MDRSAEILGYLDQAGIPYTLHRHEPKRTIEDCLITPGLDPDKATVPKNIFLCNRRQSAFYLLLLSPMRPFRTAVFSRLLGVSRLSFAPEEKLRALLSLDPGAVSPLALMFDSGRQVSLVMDEALTKYERLWFHPGLNTQSVEMATADFLGRFLPGIGRAAALVTFPEDKS